METQICRIPPLVGLDLPMVWQILHFQEIEWVDQVPFEKSQGFSRYRILGANGPILLSIPVKKHPKGALLSQIEIDHKQNWRHQHWRSIESAYGKSPFFGYFRSELGTFFETQEPLLAQFSLQWAKWILSIYFKSNRIPVKMTQNLRPIQPQGVLQLSGISALNVDETNFQYQQVFGKEFVSGLSVLDHLFCAGPKFWNLQN